MSAEAERLIRFDWTSMQIPRTGLTASAMERLAPNLTAARQDVITPSPVQAGLSPPDAAMSSKIRTAAEICQLPERTLSAYHQHRSASSLRQMLSLARQMQEEVDTVVIVGTGGTTLGASAIMASCVHPYHNQLSRADRAGIPRVFIIEDHSDNDTWQALMDLLPRNRSGGNPCNRCSLVVIEDSVHPLPDLVGQRLLLPVLQQAFVDDPQNASNVIHVGGRGSLSSAGTLPHAAPTSFSVPRGVGGATSLFTAAGLIPAAILGVNVIRLLEGARAMTQHFEDAPSGQNVVLQLAGAAHLMETERHVDQRHLCVWPDALRATGHWYQRLLLQCRAMKGISVMSPAALEGAVEFLPTGDPWSRWEWMVHWSSGGIRRDELSLPALLSDDHPSNARSTTLQQAMSAAIMSARHTMQELGCPAAMIELPTMDEYYFGQLFQLCLLSTLIECHLDTRSKLHR